MNLIEAIAILFRPYLTFIESILRMVVSIDVPIFGLPYYVWILGGTLISCIVCFVWSRS